MTAAAVGVIVLTFNAPAIDTLVPLSVIMLSPIADPEMNFDSLPIVPPGDVTPPPTPAQLPTVVQTSYVPAAAACSRYVTFAVGAANVRLDEKPPALADSVVVAP